MKEKTCVSIAIIIFISEIIRILRCNVFIRQWKNIANFAVALIKIGFHDNSGAIWNFIRKDKLGFHETFNNGVPSFFE